MGLFDILVLPEDISLPDFERNPRRYVDSNGEEKLRRWQTSNLTCGQDRYRLHPTEDVTGDIFQLERRVPPLQKTVETGNWYINEEPESELLWWNIVRWGGQMDIRHVCPIEDLIYDYMLEFQGGVLQNIEQKQTKEIDTDYPPEQ